MSTHPIPRSIRRDPWAWPRPPPAHAAAEPPRDGQWGDYATVSFIAGQ